MTCYLRFARNVTVNKINYDFRCRSFKEVPKNLYYKKNRCLQFSNPFFGFHKHSTENWSFWKNPLYSICVVYFSPFWIAVNAEPWELKNRPMRQLWRNGRLRVKRKYNHYHIFLVQKYKRASRVVAKNGLQKFLKTRFVHVITMIYGVISKNYVSIRYKVEWAYLFQPCVQKFWKYTDKPHLDFCFWPVFVFWKWGGVRTKKRKMARGARAP